MYTIVKEIPATAAGMAEPIAAGSTSSFPSESPSNCNTFMFQVKFRVKAKQ